MLVGFPVNEGNGVGDCIGVEVGVIVGLGDGEGVGLKLGLEVGDVLEDGEGDSFGRGVCVGEGKGSLVSSCTDGLFDTITSHRGVPEYSDSISKPKVLAPFSDVVVLFSVFQLHNVLFGLVSTPPNVGYGELKPKGERRLFETHCL